MPNYRLIFPAPEGVRIENAETAHYDSGDQVYKVGDVIEHQGRRWQVTSTPLEEPELGATQDLMVWPVE
jgi:hypothetical protein